MRTAGPIAISLLALLGPLAAEDVPAPTKPAVATAPSTTAPTTLVGSITALAAATRSLTIRPSAGDAVVVSTDDHTIVTVDGEPSSYGELKMDQKVTLVREGDHVIAVAAVTAPDSGKLTPKPKKKKKNE